MTKRVTIKDIAKECGVSITTVSRILNKKPGCCTPETEKRVMEAVERAHYRPNPAARSLVTKETNIIGVILPDIYNYFFQEFFKGAEDYLGKKGYILILCNTDGKAKKENEFLESLTQGMVDGIMITTGNCSENNDYIVKLSEGGFPIVTVERYGDDLEQIPGVLFDNKKAMCMAVRRLYEYGHRRIAFITGPANAANAVLRLEGYKQGLKEAGIKYEKALVCAGDYQMTSGYKSIKKLISEQEFTAVIASNDQMAVGACKAIRDSGKSVPDDISVIGFDGTMLAELYQPALYTIELHGYDMGKVSAENLLKLIKGKEAGEKKVIFEPVIKEGSSIRDITDMTL